jgi:transcriptional regulator with XRE-family HTH domain
MALGHAFRIARESAGWDVPTMEQKSGLPSPSIFEIESDRRLPSPQEMEAVAKALDMPVKSFDYLSDENPDQVGAAQKALTKAAIAIRHFKPS